MTRLRRNINLTAVVLPFAAFLAAVPLLWDRLISAGDLTILLVAYVVNIASVTIGFHRLLTHRSFASFRAIEYALAVLGSMAVQGPMINWVADHRKHHAHTDVDGDPHSPHVGHGSGLRGLWHAHVGWLLIHSSGREAQRYAPELLEDRVMRAISRAFVPLTALTLLIPFALGWLSTGTLAGAGLAVFWGGLMRIFFVHHMTWSTNSICHYFGRRRFQTLDKSTNVFWLALPSLGEAWHHNHHAFPRSAMHGLHWWEIDITGLIIRALEATGLAWNVVRIDPQRQAAKRLPSARRTHSQPTHIDRALERASRGTDNRLVYRTARAILQTLFFGYFRFRRRGRGHIPNHGAAILAANHRGVLDPIVIGLLTRRRVYYMAKKELFRKRRHAWLLGALGAFPVDRGGSDEKAIAVAHGVLARGDCLVIFPEGKCHPVGGLGQPRRGVGRLALATGAPVVPIAIAGTEASNTRRFPPPRIRVQASEPLTFTPAEHASEADNAQLVTGRVWAAIASRWEALAATRDAATEHDDSLTDGQQAIPHPSHLAPSK